MTEKTKTEPRADREGRAWRVEVEAAVSCPVCEAEIPQDVCAAIAARLGGADVVLEPVWAEKAAARGEACRRCARSPLLRADNARLQEAIAFALERHSGQLRKGTHLPYILHPLEALEILAYMQADAALMMAGVLHDVLEDTETTYAELRERFGAEVADLVAWHTDDKGEQWIFRREKAITRAAEADVRHKMLVLADKLSNLRSMARDYRTVGDALWQRFREPKEKQAWYYNGLIEALAELDEYEETCAAYEELIDRYKDLFVLYKLNPAEGKLYQANTFGQTYCLCKGSPQWRPVDYRFRQRDLPLTRKEAELLEEKWYDLFLQALEEDLADGVYPLSAADGCEARIVLSGGRLTLDACGAPAETLDEEETYQLLSCLRAEAGIAVPLPQLLQEALGQDPAETFPALCARAGLA